MPHILEARHLEQSEADGFETADNTAVEEALDGQRRALAEHARFVQGLVD